MIKKKRKLQNDCIIDLDKSQPDKIRIKIQFIKK